MTRTGYIMLLIFLPVNGICQALRFDSPEVDFGKIASVDHPPKTIGFKNTSDKDLAILLVDKGPNVKINYEHKFFHPGESGIITLMYDPRNTGNISEDLQVYTNLDDQPVQLHLKGTVVSITECFPDPHNLLKREIHTINKRTKEPVPMAKIDLTHNHNSSNRVEFTSDKEGKVVQEMPIGLYDANVTAQDYHDLSQEFFLPKSQPYVIFELDPVTKQIQHHTVPKPEPQEEEAQTNETPATAPATPPVLSTVLPENKYAANNVVLLLDVSTSMRANHKFSLLQQSVNNLVMVLRPIDYVSIITYAGDAKTIIQPVKGSEKDTLTNAVQNLSPYGITQGVKGLKLAYQMAQRNFIRGGNNQIILATDGEFSEKNISDAEYQQFISGYTQQGIKLSILGFGVNQQAIARMKKMTTAGGGSFILITPENASKDVLIDEIKEKSFVGSSSEQWQRQRQ